MLSPSSDLTNMLRRLRNRLSTIRSWKLKRGKDGQAITEYGAVLAFIAVLVALMFAFGSGSIGPAVSNAFSAISDNLDKMSAAAMGASGS